MRLVHADYEFVFDIIEGLHYQVIIENPQIFRALILQLLDEIETGEGRFVLSENFEEIPMQKHVDVITDLLQIEPYDKRVLTKITSMLKTFVTNEDMYDDTMSIISEINKYALAVAERFPYLITFDDVDINGLIKALNGRPSTDADSLVEKICERMTILHDICGISIYILINATSYLSKDELNLLIEEGNLEKHNLILIDSFDTNYTHPNLKKLIIDNDNCEIY